MEGRFWTSSEAARAFRVGVSSIKRWTDEGELESVRTPGGHRRYTVVALHRFAGIRGLATDRLLPLTPLEKDLGTPPLTNLTLYDALVRGDRDAVRRLITPRLDTLAKRAAFFDRVVGDALREIGMHWKRGEVRVDQEHRGSHVLAEAIDRLRPDDQREGRLALLACPPDEHHDFPLRLVRLLLEWSGWRTEFLGAALPWDAARAAAAAAPDLLAFSARSRDPFQSDHFARLVEEGRSRGTTVIAGGEWARGGTGAADGYLRFRTLRGFERWLRIFS